MSGVEEVQVVQTGPSFPVSVDSSVLPSTFADGRFSPGNGGGVRMLLPFILALLFLPLLLNGITNVGSSVTNPASGCPVCTTPTPVVCTTPVPCVPVKRCPGKGTGEGFQTLNKDGTTDAIPNKCFAFLNTPVEYKTAQKECDTRGGVLVDFENADETKAVNRYLVDNVPGQDFYTGYSDCFADDTFMSYGGRTLPVPGSNPDPKGTKAQTDCLTIKSALSPTLKSTKCTEKARPICQLLLDVGPACVCP